MSSELVLDICPRNQPAVGQTYATVVFGEGRVSGEQMLTVGRGLWTTATNQWRAFPASGLAAVIYVLDNCLGTQHSALWLRRRVVMQRQTQIVRRYSTLPAQHKQRHVVTLRYEARAEHEARDTRTGLAALPLVSKTSSAVLSAIGIFSIFLLLLRVTISPNGSLICGPG